MDLFDMITGGNEGEKQEKANPELEYAKIKAQTAAKGLVYNF